MTDREWKIRETLKRYRVNMHYQASSAVSGRISRYAVFTGDPGMVQQVGEPCSHAEAVRLRDDLIVRDLLELFGDPE